MPAVALSLWLRPGIFHDLEFAASRVFSFQSL